jgi:adenylate cyclase
MATCRLAAILAADVAGYSRLMGADEEGTLDRLKAHRKELIDPAIAEHNGRIVKTTGDGVLVEFPSVVGAVRCAVEVQRGMAQRNVESAAGTRIEFRIGINLGDIILDDGDIFGDGVNIAARLEALAEPGGICVSRVVRDQVRDKLAIEFADQGEQQVKNIARPVHVYRIARPAEAEATPGAEPQLTLPLPDKPSIAVLPFANMSNDPDQEFFADGIAEDVITALSRYPSLFVIARNSCFTYKGRPVDVKQVGSELGVRYVLEGSLRKSGNRIRVTAQLVEAETGKHVWAERCDRDLADIFALQDDITEATTIAIAPAIADAEQQRAMRKLPQSIDAWAAYQRGLWHFSRVNADDNAQAQNFYQQAIDLDPRFSGGYGGLTRAQIQAASVLQTVSLQDAQISAESLARRAVALDGADAGARSCLGLAYWARGHLEDALIEIERALAISPNLADAHWVRAHTLVFLGKPKEGLAALDTWIRLDPRNPISRLHAYLMALAFYFSGSYDTTVEIAGRATRSYPDFSNSYRVLAAALGQLGRAAEAREALEKAVSLAPAAFDMYVRQRVPWMRPEDHAHMVEGLRKAGWEG